jgi:DNA-binding NtrC family response regulator
MADGLHFVPCPTVSKALQLLRAGNSYSAVFCALRMGQINGPELLRSIRSEFPRLPVIVVTNPKDLRFAILACIFGASDFIQTPLNAVKIRASLDRAMIRKIIELALPDGENSAIRKKPVSPVNPKVDTPRKRHSRM